MVPVVVAVGVFVLHSLMLVFVAVFALQSAACQAERDRRIDGYMAAGLTEAEACALVDDLP